ncbi:hypothetical protein JTB14_017754 [Gonioctena quinquepunctata]|nr:hypothetical protein JTB14_017754 [Gonioctena quinquepunctata]
MSRLQNCLKGKARETVHTLLNFPNKLKDVLQIARRFGRKKYIIEQIFTQLKHTKQVREDNLENLVELSNTLQNMTVCLKSLNCEEYLINPQILRELIDKMPLNLRMNLGIHVKSQQKKVVSIKDFSLWLEELTQTISYMQLSPIKKTERNHSDNEFRDELPCSSSRVNRKLVLLKIVPVTLEGPNGTIETCALCDEASTITIIEEEIAKVLGCVVEKGPLTMKWTDDTIKKENGSRKVSAQIKGKHENKQITIRNARTMKQDEQ